jgi:hypothetical protein
MSYIAFSTCIEYNLRCRSVSKLFVVLIDNWGIWTMYGLVYVGKFLRDDTSS